jgi:hypothetical protein
MTKLNDMKDAPKDGTEILIMNTYKGNKFWEIIKFYENEWINACKFYLIEEEILGWLPLPELPKE